MWTLVMSPILVFSYPYTIYQLAIDEIDGTSIASYDQISDEMKKYNYRNALLHITLNENRFIEPIFYEIALYAKSDHFTRFIN